jgi:ribonuclease PH
MSSILQYINVIFMRTDRRDRNELRALKLERGTLQNAEGSCLIRLGRTWAICTATVEEGVPDFLAGKGSGWVTAEYSMLPRATRTRSGRERMPTPVRGRTAEIQRMIGRCLRAATDLDGLEGFTVCVDCDVLQADGGTRTACVTAGFVALAEALAYLKASGRLRTLPLRDTVAAVSVGLVGGEVCLDLSYEEDARAGADVNFAMTGKGLWVEVQATAEKQAFSTRKMNEMMRLGAEGIGRLMQAQRKALKGLKLRW